VKNRHIYPEFSDLDGVLHIEAEEKASHLHPRLKGGCDGKKNPSPRWAVTETTIGDQRIEAGQFLFPWIASANRDEARFPGADQFTIEREPNRHLGFGRGIEVGLGSLRKGTL
jgi:hypothetical protein